VAAAVSIDVSDRRLNLVKSASSGVLDVDQLSG